MKVVKAELPDKAGYRTIHMRRVYTPWVHGVGVCGVCVCACGCAHMRKPEADVFLGSSEDAPTPQAVKDRVVI